MKGPPAIGRGPRDERSPVRVAVPGPSDRLPLIDAGLLEGATDGSGDMKISPFMDIPLSCCWLAVGPSEGCLCARPCRRGESAGLGIRSVRPPLELTVAGLEGDGASRTASPSAVEGDERWTSSVGSSFLTPRFGSWREGTRGDEARPRPLPRPPPRPIPLPRDARGRVSLGIFSLSDCPDFLPSPSDELNSVKDEELLSSDPSTSMEERVPDRRSGAFGSRTLRQKLRVTTASGTR